MESASTIIIYLLRHIEKLTRSLRSLFRFFGASQLVNENRSCALPIEQSSFTKYLRSLVSQSNVYLFGCKAL